MAGFNGANISVILFGLLFIEAVIVLVGKLVYDAVAKNGGGDA